MKVSPSLELSRRLEAAEGRACALFAEAWKARHPESGSAWIECGGAVAVFNGVESPVTQTFGFGIFEDATAETLETMEKFFFERGTAAVHEVSPLAGVAALDLLCARNYRPVELSNVLYRVVEAPAAVGDAHIEATLAGPEERKICGEILGRVWLQLFPDQGAFIAESDAIAETRKDSARFLARYDGEPGAAATLFLHDGVALFGGGATLPEMRRRGLQTALIRARMQYALERGCDLLMLVAEAGSDSQRNAERNGFRVAYTRTKWRKEAPGAGTAKPV